MTVDPLDNELRERLTRELGKHGCDAVASLDTAHVLLNSGLQAPRIGRAVAGELRSALNEILKAADVPAQDSWRVLSRKVVNAYTRFNDRMRVDASDTAGELCDLDIAMDELHRFHDFESLKAEIELTEVMLSVTGHELTGDDPAITAFLKLRSALNDDEHTSQDAGGVARWEECTDVLRRLFLPPDARFERLEKLASLDDPNEDDAVEVVRLMTTSTHALRFWEKVDSFNWFQVLDKEGMLDPPVEGVWAAGGALRRLAETDPDETSRWLDVVYERHNGDPHRVAKIAWVAVLATGSSRRLVIDAVRRHPGHEEIVWVSLRLLHELDADDDMVQTIVDILLNHTAAVPQHSLKDLFGQLVEGCNPGNAKGRCRLLFHKVASLVDEANEAKARTDQPRAEAEFRDLSPNEIADLIYKSRHGSDPADAPAFDTVRYLSDLESEVHRSICDEDHLNQHGHCYLLVRCLVDLISKSWLWLSLDDLLKEVERLDHPYLRGRLRAWILSNVPSVDGSLLVEEVAAAVRARRSPNTDDLAVIDRAVAICDESSVGVWTDAFGDAPTVTEVQEAVDADDPQIEWLDLAWWASLLPVGVPESWEAPAAVLSKRYDMNRARLQRERAVVPTRSTPISVEELKTVPVAQAVQMISAWRPGPATWWGDARMIAISLGAVVTADPVAWMSDPVAVVTELQHPIFISQYLRSVAALASQPDLPIPVNELLDAVLLTRTHPQSDHPLAPDTTPASVDTDIDQTLLRMIGGEWDNVDRASVDLVQALVEADCDIWERSRDVWGVLSTAARDCSKCWWPDGPDHSDPYERAANQPCTSALRTAVLLASRTFQESGAVPSEALELFDAGLSLEDRNGVEHRAVLAPWIGFLRTTAPDWFHSKLDLMFGSAAPDGLTQSMIDSALSWGRVDSWILENYPEMVRDAIIRDVERSIDHLVVGMLQDVPGWSVAANVDFLTRSKSPSKNSSAVDDAVEPTSLLVQAARRLAAVLQYDDAETKHLEIAAEFWQATLDDNAQNDLRGFGGFAAVTKMDHDKWEQLTLKTLQVTLTTQQASNGTQIDRYQDIAERVASATPVTLAGLQIFRLLVHSAIGHWQLHDICTTIAEATRETASSPELTLLQDAIKERGFETT